MHGAYVCRLPVRYVHALPVNGDAMKKHDIVRTSVCGLLSAASLALLAVGSFSGTLELSAAAAASLAVVYIRIEFGTVPALSVYACVSLLSLLLLPQKTGALVYALGAGAYPVFKAFAESRFRTVPGWILKLAFFNAALTLVIAAGDLPSLTFPRLRLRRPDIYCRKCRIRRLRRGAYHAHYFVFPPVPRQKMKRGLL